jgi:predicted SnoaL-like aldol condensation-catalyzing enzyme
MAGSQAIDDRGIESQADVVRIADGVLVEHWDVLYGEASREESQGGLQRFGREFPT